MSKSRVVNSALNVTTGILYQLLILILQFISRTIFIRVLGVEYLGVNGLFNNILSVLSLAELGAGSAMVYSMYKPLAENDKPKLTALINYYKKIYNTIAAVIGIAGLAIVPFLNVLVKLNKPINDIVLYYVLFLANSVLSYLFVYRTSIANADQKSYKLKVYNMTFAIIQFVLQILVLLVLHSYLLYIVVQIACTFFVNVLSARKTAQMYPFIKGKEQLKTNEKESIWSNVRSFFMYQIGGVVLNNTDNILISVILGTVWVGYYSNYYMIIAQIAAFTSLVFVSLQSSIGSLNTECDTEKKYFIFKVLNLLSFWIYGVCGVCFCLLFQDFITLWLGDHFLIDIMAVYMAVATFYLQGVLYPIWCYRNTTGLFKRTKYVMLYASVINLGLSVWWGYEFGLVGILGATVVARLATNIWYEPLVLYRTYFKKNALEYFIKQGVLLVLLFLTGAITYAATMWLNGITVWGFLGKLILCLIIPNGVFFIIFRTSSEFQYIEKNYAAKILQRLKSGK